VLSLKIFDSPKFGNKNATREIEENLQKENLNINKLNLNSHLATRLVNITLGG